MKNSIIVVIVMLFSTLLKANTSLPLPHKVNNFISLTVAPPNSNMVYTALKESESFHKEFVTIVSQASMTVHQSNWSFGVSNPNTAEYYRWQFANLVLKGDEKTITRLKNYLINTAFSYTITDDVQLRNEIRDNFITNFDELASVH